MSTLENLPDGVRKELLALICDKRASGKTVSVISSSQDLDRSLGHGKIRTGDTYVTLAFDGEETTLKFVGIKRKLLRCYPDDDDDFSEAPNEMREIPLLGTPRSSQLRVTQVTEVFEATEPIGGSLWATTHSTTGSDGYGSAQCKACKENFPIRQTVFGIRIGHALESPEFYCKECAKEFSVMAWESPSEMEW